MPQGHTAGRWKKTEPYACWAFTFLGPSFPTSRKEWVEKEGILLRHCPAPQQIFWNWHRDTLHTFAPAETVFVPPHWTYKGS